MDSFVPSIWLPLSLVGLYLGILLIFAETLGRLTPIKEEWTRKIVHIGAGNVLLFAWWFNVPAWVGVTAAVIAAIIALISYKLPILPSIQSVGRDSLGTFFYAVSVGSLVGIFWTVGQPYYGVLGILVMTWGDGMAAIIGQKWGKHPYFAWGIKKSWEGSLTMLIVSFIVTLLILLSVYGNQWSIYLISLGIGMVATLLESFSKLGIDNLTVPLGSAVLAFWLGNLLIQG